MSETQDTDSVGSTVEKEGTSDKQVKMAEGVSERTTIDAAIAQRVQLFLDSFAEKIADHSGPNIPPASLELLQARISRKALIPMYVMACDIRSSTLFLKETTDPLLFSIVLSDFIDNAKEAIWSTGGFFDKFTGDGFLAYWIPGEIYQQGDKSDHDILGDAIIKMTNNMLEVYRKCSLWYSGNSIINMRKRQSNVPLIQGVSFGVDAGFAQLVPFGNDITVLGLPVVGAVRMVSSAPPYTIVLNNYPGEALAPIAKNMDKDLNISWFRKLLRTKEYPKGQEVFLLWDRGVDSTHLSSTFPFLERCRQEFELWRDEP